ncbi:MAG: M28 family metallopeptidase [Saprospiraceae bacterium]
MKHTIPGLLLVAALAIFNSCKNDAGGTAYGAGATTVIDSTLIAQHLKTLASDEFLGRKPFTEGETKTVAYLEGELKKLGLEPGNNGSYFQEVPLVEITPVPDSTMQIKGKNGNFTLKLRDDYVLYTQREQENIQVKDAELVFCGYGVVAPEIGWNDYAGMDMKNKIAVVLVNDPDFGGGDTTLFKGNTMTYFGRWTYKYEEAARQGALGVLIIHETRAAGYPWLVPQGSLVPRLSLQTGNNGANYTAIQGWMTLTAAAQLFKAANVKGDELFTKAKQKGFKPIPLGLTASTGVKNTFKKSTSRNVVAMLRGTERPDETIIYSTHWDHLGVGAPVEGDSIYNGAVDNASGTAALLAIAKAFTQLPEKPKRSMVFLFVTAEEQGLLGSEYYAAHPIFPVNKTVANINMDALNPNGRMKDLTIVGFGQSDLEDYARAEAEKQGRYVQPEQEPEKGFYFRSDHFNFAKIGIPALYASGSYDHWEKGKEYARAKSDEFEAAHYHQPSDEYTTGAWDLGGITQDAALFYNIGLKLANETTFPDWKTGSEFKGIRKLQ